MSLQIRSIILYHSSGNTRNLSFELGRVNIITGKSNTGKSSLAEIVDYCLGRSTFTIPEGVIRDSVAWYAVVLQVFDTQVFIAKPAPSGDAATPSQSQVFLHVANEVNIPPLSELKTNSNDDAVVEYLSGLLGISRNLNIPEEGQTRRPLEATLRHSKFYLFQPQSVVANKDVLFFRQAEPYIPQTIKDTLPYFLGAVKEERLRILNELRIAKRDLSRAKRRLSESESITSEFSDRAYALLIEAQQVGLVSTEVAPQDLQELLELLKVTLSWQPSSVLPISNDRLLQLQKTVNDLRDEFEHVHGRIQGVQLHLEEARGYSSEAVHQKMRLQSIELIEETNGHQSLCPLCSSEMKQLIPSVTAVKGALEEMNRSLQSVDRERPRLEDYLRELTEKQEEIRHEIERNELAIEGILAEDEVARQIRDANSRISRVVGRISLYLETVELTNAVSPLRDEVAKLEMLVHKYEEQLDPNEVNDVQASILSIMASWMSQWAVRLRLEHSGFPYRFDIEKLTVIADRPGRPIPLERMGGGENWLGSHLIVIMALHRYFVEQARPVPHFVFLDQPTQVYFPSDVYAALEGRKGELRDYDREAVNRMFEFLFDVCQELAPHFQIIVTEHANLDTDRFQSALVEEPWTEGLALIPQNWLTDDPS